MCAITTCYSSAIQCRIIAEEKESILLFSNSYFPVVMNGCQVSVYTLQDIQGFVISKPKPQKGLCC